MENPYAYKKKKKRNQKNSFLKAIFFSHEPTIRLPKTIPPGLKMSQKGSFEGTDS